MSKIPPHVFLNDPHAPAVCHRCEQVLQHATSLKNHVNTMSCKKAEERLRKGDVRCGGCNKIFIRTSYDNHVRTMRCHQNSELLKIHRKREEYIRNNVFNPAVHKDCSRENAFLEYVAKLKRGEASDETIPPPVKKHRLAPPTINNPVRPGNATRFRVHKPSANGGLPSCFIKPKNWNRSAAAARERVVNPAREQEAKLAREREAKRAKEELEDKIANEIVEEEIAGMAREKKAKQSLNMKIKPPRKATPAASSASNAAAITAAAQLQRTTVDKQQNETQKGPESRSGNRPVNPWNVINGTALKPASKEFIRECMEEIEKGAVARRALFSSQRR